MASALTTVFQVFLHATTYTDTGEKRIAHTWKFEIKPLWVLICTLCKLIRLHVKSQCLFFPKTSPIVALFPWSSDTREIRLYIAVELTVLLFLNTNVQCLRIPAKFLSMRNAFFIPVTYTYLVLKPLSIIQNSVSVGSRFKKNTISLFLVFVA